MFRLNRHKSDRTSGDRIEFKLSNFQVLQVPKGWDKLFLSVVSVETGKTIVKSSKATVHGGTCQWIETFSESIWAYQNDVSKELEKCLYKILVAMGSARSGILGEVILNLTNYMSSRDSGPLSLPLKKCNHGTILQIKIQCHSPKSKSRDQKSWKETTYHCENPHPQSEDMDSKSDGSDNAFNKSLSSSSSHLGIISYPDEPGNKEMSLSTSGSHPSSDSGENSIGRTIFSPINSLNGGAYMGRQDSAESHISAASGVGAVDDFSRSNQSSFNSTVSGSSIHANQCQEITSQKSAHGVAPLSLRSSDSSKNLLEAAEETIDELREEAKMWERHCQKLKLELEMLKKESSDKSKYQVDLEMELSAAFSERDSLKQEVELLKSSLGELMAKQTVIGTNKIDEMTRMQTELEDEVKFQNEANANLTLQLKKTQEANAELVSILQELEETVEKQSLEITSLSKNHHVDEAEEDLRSQMLLGMEAEWENKLTAKEEEIIKLKEKLSDILNAEHRSELVCDGADSYLIKNIDALKAKVQELERDCSELTEENLELIFKMKESKKDNREGKVSHDSTFDVSKSDSLDNSELEIDLLKSQINHLELELKKKGMFDEGLIVPLKIQVKNLEEKFSDLDLELQHFKEQACNLDIELQKSQAEVKEKVCKFTEVQQKLETLQDTGLGCFDAGNGRKLEEIETCSTSEMSRILSEINEQLRLALTCVRKLCYVGKSAVTTEYVDDNDFVKSSRRDSITQKEQAEAVLANFNELNDLLRANIVKCESLYQDLKACLSLKEKEVDVLEHSNRDLKDLISNIQREKGQLEENFTVSLWESSITSKCLDDVQHDLMILTSNLESQVSTNKMLERKSLELENGKHELELHISELEEENVQFSERISGLEAQLRYLTNEKQSNRLELELEDSRLFIMDLKDEITKQKTELETLKVELKQKVQEAQKRLSEALEESEYLKGSHLKFQGKVESLIEECHSLQKLNGDLRMQKSELHERCTHLEVELDESQKKSIHFREKVEFLEVRLSSLQKDIALKERSLNSQIESIFQEHNEHEEKIKQAHVMLNQMESAKSIEVENLERQIVHLTSQVSSTYDDRETIASESAHEVFNLRLEKSKLESTLQEALAKVKLYETELHSLRQESGNKVQGFVDLLNASKQSEAMLMADIDHMQRLMETVSASENKFRKMANELELKLKASDYEKQQIMEEISTLKVQLQKIAHLQDEIVNLEISLDEAKFEKRKLEESLQSVSDNCEEFKTERVSFMEKISNMQKALHDGESDRRCRIALEERLLRLEGDLTAREASCAYEVELKNELSRIKRSNSEYQRKIQCLEEEKDNLLWKTHLLEKELMLKNETSHDEKVPSEGDNKLQACMKRSEVGKEIDLESRIHVLENELAQALEENNTYKMQLTSLLSEKQNDDSGISTEAASEKETRNNNASKIASLEAELIDMQDRYLHMSLHYAEVETQREELVMQLKSVKKGRWYS